MSEPRMKTIVLHGRVQRVAVEDDDDIQVPTFKQRSVFSQLTTEIEQFSKIVGNLEQVLKTCGDTPADAWRMRILLKSAVDTDQDLYQRLFNYEKTLHSQRSQQTACMKLHRDFKRAHKGLLLAVSMYEKKQKVEMSQLGAVGWTNIKDDEDFYDRAMREREEQIAAMNRDMHKVNDLYNELAQLVDDQQDKVNRLGDQTDDAKANVDLGLLCISNEVLPKYDCNPFHCQDNDSMDWSSAWKTITDDMQAIQKDIMELGKDLIPNNEESNSPKQKK